MRILIRAAAACYPARWRVRYGEGIEALLQGMEAGLAGFVKILVGALAGALRRGIRGAPRGDEAWLGGIRQHSDRSIDHASSTWGSHGGRVRRARHARRWRGGVAPARDLRIHGDAATAVDR